MTIKKNFGVITGVFAAALCASPVSHAVLVNPGGDGPGTGLQDVLNGITIGGVSSIDVNADQLSDPTDSLWSITGSGQSAVTFVIELAGFANTNTLGVYDAANPSSKVELFNGPASPGLANGGVVLMTIDATGRVFRNFYDTGVTFSANSFGYYLDSTAGGSAGGVFFSDTGLNTDGIDHMVAYQGKNIDTVQVAASQPGLWTNNEFVLGWEDLTGGGDGDYQDLVMMVSSVLPVPVPATVWLFGSGLLGMVGIARRKKAT